MSETLSAVARLKRLEVLLDRKFGFPGMRFGLDGVLGLVPVAGDVAAAGLGLYLIFEANRHGARRATTVRMVWNWGLDLALGAVPLAGDVFDFAFRSNTKNVRLLIADLESRAAELRKSKRVESLRRAA